MKLSNWVDRRHLATALLAALLLLQFTSLVMHAQNLGTQPATGQAVQGQTAAQPEGAVTSGTLHTPSVSLCLQAEHPSTRPPWMYRVLTTALHSAGPR